MTRSDNSFRPVYVCVCVCVCACVCMCVGHVCICAHVYACVVCVWCAQESEGVGVKVEVCAKLCTWCLCVQGVLIFSANYSSITF